MTDQDKPHYSDLREGGMMHTEHDWIWTPPWWIYASAIITFAGVVAAVWKAVTWWI